MSLPETCPFCGSALSSLGFDGQHFKSFSCGTTIWHHKHPESVRSRDCRISERDRLQARLAALEAEAKQAREDEAWALDSAVTIHPDGASKSFAPMFWSVRYWDGVRTLEVTAPTIHAALRALRAKVEGGAR